jgi:hypothetical protein
LEVPAFATQQQDPRTRRWTTLSVWCPADARPVPDARAILDAVIRLLPRVGIGEPPGQHETLVNLQTVLWAVTKPERDLGRVAVIGQQVWLRLHFDHADWDFGDGSTDRTSDPGRPYDATGDPCAASACPGYYGHRYVSNGSARLGLTVAWRAEYSLDATNWIAVASPPLDGPQTQAQLRVLQARGVLVPDPSPH